MDDAFVLNYRGAYIRVRRDADYNPLYCAKDVCAVLGYCNNRKAVQRLIDPKNVVKISTQTTAGARNMTYVTEPGLRDLILHSKAPNALDFLRWVPNVWKVLCNAKFAAKTQAAAPALQATPRELHKLLATVKAVLKFEGAKDLKVTLVPVK